LVDILIELYLIRFDDSQKSMAFYKFLRESESNLLIESGPHKIFGGDLYDVPKNLFKIICAIMNLDFHQRSHNIFDERQFQLIINEIGNQKNYESLIID
jgi:hypothetical protein